MAGCISAMRFRRCSMRTSRTRWAAGCCCASRISIRCVRAPSSKPGYTRISPGSGSGGKQPVLRQSAEIGRYAAALDGLKSRRLVYPCFCTRAGLRRMVAERGTAWPVDPDGTPHYAGQCRDIEPAEAARRIASGEPHAWRLSMDRALREAGDRVSMAVMGSRRRFDRACRRQTRRMGRCRAWPQGRTDQLPPVGGARRCAAGRLPCRARSGPVCIDGRARPPAAPARPAIPALPPPQAASGRGRRQARQERERQAVAAMEGRWQDARLGPAAGWPGSGPCRPGSNARRAGRR